MRCIICSALKQFTQYAEHHNIHLNRNSTQPNQQQTNSSTTQQNQSVDSQDLSQDSTSSSTSSQPNQHSQQANSINIIPFEPIFNAFLKQTNIRLLLHNEELLQSFTAPYIKTSH